ncbi:MAG: queuosine precursor transporter [Legionellaceae bacterium]|nr:queuosine precursor transporter [Legionellaceae bacterium]
MFDNKISYISSTQSNIHFKYKYLFFTFFSATWLISCIAAVKLVSIFGLTLTGGFMIFPFTSLAGTLIIEIYGYKNARQAVWSGFLLNILFVLFIYLVSVFPASPYWDLQNEFDIILMQSLRITCASLVSFMISFFLNAYIMSNMKLRNNGKALLKRILLSSTVAITVDIVCFITLAFAGTLPTAAFMKLLIAAFCKKIICEILLLPVIWYFIDKVKANEGIEIFDFSTNFNPFSMDNVYDFNDYKKTAIK